MSSPKPRAESVLLAAESQPGIGVVDRFVPVGSCAIVLSPDWPGASSGYQIALRSSLQDYASAYRRVVYVVPAETGRRPPVPMENVEWVHIRYSRGSPIFRMLKSVTSTFPAVVQFFNCASLANDILAHLQEHRIVPEETDLIYEDLPITVMHYHLCRHRLPFAQTVLRSHNVLSECFEGFSHGVGLRQLAWKLENARVRRYEARVLRRMEKVYAITRRDRDEYFRRYRHTIDGYLGVRFDRTTFEGRRQCLTPACYKNLIHLGGMDLRKEHGMREFICGTFRRLRANDPAIQLILGGRRSERFQDTANHVYGMGFVADEEEFMARGAIFINTQLLGSGIKLKSLVAMSYGKTVVSTSKGMEGIDVQPGKHCIVVEHVDDMYEAVSELLAKPKTIEEIGYNAAQFVLQTYCT